MLHYSGPISRKPGRVACGAPLPVDTTERWRTTECEACREALIDTPVRRSIAADGRVWRPVGLHSRGPWVACAGQASPVGWFELDMHWQRVS